MKIEHGIVISDSPIKPRRFFFSSFDYGECIASAKRWLFEQKDKNKRFFCLHYKITWSDFEKQTFKGIVNVYVARDCTNEQIINTIR